MRKLHRTALFAGMLAIGVAACGDDVTISDPPTPPPPPLSVTLTPSNQTISVGEVADFVVTVSGGAEGASVSFTCASSNTSVASVSSTETGCRVTGLEQGNATITATVTKGNQSASAGGQVTVTAEGGEPATVSISSVTKGGLTQPVDQDNVFGQIDVTLNVTPNDQTVTRVEVLVDGEVAAAQELTAAFLEEQLALHEDEDEEIAEQVQQITLSFNTAAYDVDEEALTATPKYLNGQRQIQARIFVAETPSEPAASNVLTLRFNNADAFHVLADTEGGQALSAEGLLWIGGPEFGIEVSPVPVMYSGRTVTRISLQIRRLQAATPVATERCTAAPVTRQLDEGDSLTFEFTCVGTESDLMVPFITSVAAGNPGPTAGIDIDGNYFGVANLTASDDHPFPARIDVRAPQTVDTDVFVYRMVRQPGLLNVGNWVNDQYNFHGTATGAGQTYNTDNVADGGVGKAGVLFQVSTDTLVTTVVAGPANPLTGADLNEAIEGGAESVTNTAYRAWAVQPDRLENTAFFLQEANPDDHLLRTFGYDETDPTFVFAEEDDALGAIEGAHNFINQFAADDGIDVVATDLLSGFFQPTASEHAIIGIRGEFNGQGAIQTTGVVVGTSAVIAAEPFAAARDGDRIATPLATVSTDFLNFIDQTRFRVTINDFGSLIADPRTDAAARYYLYQLQMRDRAGNVVRGYRAIYLNNNSVPNIENLSNPSLFDANASYTVGVVRDSVEVLEGSLEIRYPSAEGTIVWERPTSELSSVLRMNADILDGELFNDVIYRPQSSVAFPLGLAELGIPFIKSVQAVDADGVPVDPSDTDIQPDSTRARIFNGWGVEQGYHHSTALPTGDGGVSALISRSIAAEEAPQPSFFFNEHVDGDWSFRLVEGSAPDCEAEWCVRAIGPLSTFTNPFDGGPVLILWADDAGTGVAGELQWRVLTVATPNFDDPFPTRDSGADRIYEWEFNISDLVTGDLTGEVTMAALGVHAGNPGDALLTQAGLPDPAFNVRFDPAEADLSNENGQSVDFTLVHGSNSTGGAFTLNSCEWVDANGNVLVTDPAGLDLTAAGTTCTVTVTDATQRSAGEAFNVRGNASQNGDTSSATATVTLINPAFTIALDPETATVGVPAEGTTETVDYTASSTSGGAISALSCSIAPTTGVSVATVGSVCRVTVTDSAAEDTYTVTANATETGTGSTASATAELEVTEAVPFTIALSPTSETVGVPAAGTTETVVYTASSTSGGPIGVLTCSIDPTTGVTVAAVASTCEVEVTDAAPDGTTYTVTADATEDGTTREASATASLTVTDTPATSFSTDFSANTLGAFPGDWTDRGLVADGANVTVEADAGFLGGQALRVEYPAAHTVQRNVSWNDPGNLENVRIRALVNPTSGTGGTVPAYISGRGGPDDTYYRLQIRNDNTLELAKVVGGTLTVPIGTAATFNYTAGDRIFLELEIEGDQLRGRAWQEGAAVPAFMVTETDTEITTAGWVGLGRLQQGVTNFDSFEVTVLP